MALEQNALVLAGNAINGGITHMQLHSGARGAAGTTAAVGTRVATTGVVGTTGTVTWSNVAFTGLSANQALAQVSYWSALTGGTYRGGAALTGDAAANAAGAYTVTQVTETASAS